MFLDEATIEVTGGTGGRGCVSWRREKYVPMGGPDGGEGGKGGDVFLVADENTDTLSIFASTKKFEADEGGFGMGRNKAGRGGEDKTLLVPPGTVVYEVKDGEKVLVAELLTNGDSMLAAHGGRGGFGNSHFKSSTRQRPDFAELGEPGETRTLKLELKLVADVGIIGYPSVGKSSLISVISSAKPKIADYPFTTLVPNLGVVQVQDRSYVVCDVPGLIEGASEGKGLGHQFLKHIERCGVLLHVLDVHRASDEGSTDPDTIDIDRLVHDYKAIREELEAYSPTLAKKQELVILNKIDLIGGDATKLEKELKKKKITIFLSISAAATLNVEELKKRLLPVVTDARKKRFDDEESEREKERAELPVLRPHLAAGGMGAYRMDQDEDGTIRITGKRLEQFTNMTNFQSEGAVRRFRDVLERIGLLKTLKRKRKGDAEVLIGKVRVDPYL